MSEPAQVDAPGKGDDVDVISLARQYGLDWVDALPADALVVDLVRDVPVEWARTHCVLPVHLSGEPCILTCDPTSVEAHEYLAMLVGGHLRPVLAPRNLILQSIEACYFSRSSSPDDFLRDMGGGDAAERKPVGGDDLLQVAKEAPVTQLVNLILLDAVKRGASDIHFEPFEDRLRVRYRLDGVLYEQTAPAKHLEDALISRLKVMGRLDIAERRLPQDGMARVRVGEREIDIRLSTVPVAEGERVVLRLLDRDSALLPLTDLGMSGALLRRFEGLLTEPNGIVVVSGPTGSGKTTTLYAALAGLDASRRNIMTIEDPIEYQLPDIGQIQVKPKIGLTFAAGLRHVLRQDPDVILVGETRDMETAEIGIRASLTGHLVFTTLHTNDAASAVVRLVDMGVEPYLLASCLRGILAQRLVRCLCTQCRRDTVVGEEDIAGSEATMGGLVGRPAFAPEGCSLCIEGFRGRTGLFEMLLVSRPVQQAIRRGEIASETFRECGRESDMPSLLEDGIAKILSGVTSVSEVLGVAARS